MLFKTVVRDSGWGKGRGRGWQCRSSAEKETAGRASVLASYPHHPYRLNSQFHFLHLHDEKETFAAIHEQAARRLGIFDGEIIRLANDCGSVEVKAVYSTHVPEDTLFMYEGWNPGSEVEINKLFPPPAQTGGNPAGCLHTFVKAEKL